LLVVSRGCQAHSGKATGVRHVARVFSADCGRRRGCRIDDTFAGRSKLQLMRCACSASRSARCAAHSRRHRTEPNPRGSCARYGSSDAVFSQVRGSFRSFRLVSRARGVARNQPTEQRSQCAPRRRAPQVTNVKWTTLCTYTNSWVRLMRRRGRGGGGGWEVLVV